MLGAFKSFLAEVKKKYPYSYRRGDFEPLADMFTDLSNETTPAGIRISDMAVTISRWPDLVERIYLLEKLVDDLRDLGSPAASV
jgi:hypothetical protein